jgi:hypothetical protein
VTIDQFTKYVKTVRRRGWYLIGSNPRLKVSSSRKKVTVLGAVTADGDSLYFWTEENLTAAHGIRLLQALIDEFGEKLVVLLDQAPYFYAKDLWEFVSGKRSTECVDDTSVECVSGSALQAWYYPSHLPELNPLESCWNQFKDWFKYRLIEDLPELKQTISTAFTTIAEPNIIDYICPE